MPLFPKLSWWTAALIVLGVILLAFVIGASDSVHACLSGKPQGQAGKSAQEGFAIFSVVIVSPRCIWFFLREDSGAIIAVATIALFIATYRLWKSTGEMVAKSDTASANMIRQMKETAERELRAYVGLRGGTYEHQISTPQHSVRFKLTPVITNSGQTPAYSVCCAVRVCISPFLGPSADYSLSKDEDVQIGVLGPRETIPLAVWADEHYPPTTMAALLAGGGKWIYIYGNITYRDAFGEDRITNFCYWINTTGSDPDGAAIWTLHPWHNDAT